MTRLTFTPTVLRWTAALAAALSLSACAPLVLGTAVGGAFVATDRRTSGMQLEDQGIKLKAANRIRDALKDRGHVNVHAYNRMVLLTGEVPTEDDRAAAAVAAGQTENVSGVVNELMVGLVTEREANRVAELVSTISGVGRVVKVFQIISEDELARKLPRPASPAASESSTQP